MNPYEPPQSVDNLKTEGAKSFNEIIEALAIIVFALFILTFFSDFISGLVSRK